MEIIVKYEHSYVEGQYIDAHEGKCYFFTSIAAVIEQYLKNEGINYKVDAVETKCVAMGDPYCEFVFRRRE